ncbi:cbb3-type cytochrome c oxidase subunit 3 [Candidatus Venteria ishoeyi]|uniref:cbb3-type cytochrome oxidase subunit 3 n=1 Tax=Candidatus Venteria ishoeyi TaxID=1899563 RepID=UPI0025A53F69|nr:cbb3-type cytochrome c oxidase subunit 3 [Candidatus Venteria ishoeyi]MDM8545119.1 cbb3-type cytochrome c oxidase subunit 3 [Candidatus Venteria ishoeyi]
MEQFYAVFQSIWTVLVMVMFLGIIAWAWSGSNKKAFDEAAHLPFDDEDEFKAKASVKENNHV